MKKSLLFICISCALAAVFFQYHDRQFMWLFKPLPLILMISALGIIGVKSTYRTLIMTGLVFSMIGDIFLIIPETYFLHGLCSFLVAHIFYIIAFYRSQTAFYRTSLWAYAYGVIMYLVVFNGISLELKIPVAVYTLAISSMLYMALNFHLSQKNNRSRWALMGATLFVISDSLIAINKFSYPFFLARFFILITYYVAQGFIFSSVEKNPKQSTGK